MTTLPIPKTPAPEATTTLPPAITANPSHFLRGLIEADLRHHRYATRRWAGSPGGAAHHQKAPLDTAAIRTRFPPEPNGHLHIGHAKSICLNFGLAQDYEGVCHLRLDDTNPEKENETFVKGILDAVHWLGFSWESPENGGQNHLYRASDYFSFMYEAACFLIQEGLAYVDEQNAEQIRLTRGDFSTPGTPSPYRDRSPQDNLIQFQAMRQGVHPDGAMVLRAKIDMASPNINLRDPALYRIRHATHHCTGNTWCIYPMYTFAHPIEDALENITHSICTLEFEDQRPFYDWLLGHLVQGGLIQAPPPRQYEFARLNLTYVVTSKRKLAQLVEQQHVRGWDDPRLPTLAGLRRRGYTPEAIRLFCERIGVSKAESWIDYSTLEGSLRDTLDPLAPRAMAVLDPLSLILTNWQEIFGDALSEPCTAPIHPHHPEQGQRTFHLGPCLWIERSDFEETPSKGFFRLFPGNLVRLKYGYVIQCIGALRNSHGEITAIQAKLVPDTKSGTPGANAVKVKGVMTWVNTEEALPAEVRLYDRLFTQAQPGSGDADFLEVLNPASLQTIQAYVEPDLVKALPEDRFQFERHGYFVADQQDHQQGKTLVFNRVTSLRDSWNT
jgi:glutaminyl-tRNA synthetase